MTEKNIGERMINWQYIETVTEAIYLTANYRSARLDLPEKDALELVRRNQFLQRLVLLGIFEDMEDIHKAHDLLRKAHNALAAEVVQSRQQRFPSVSIPSGWIEAGKCCESARVLAGLEAWLDYLIKNHRGYWFYDEERERIREKIQELKEKKQHD